MRPWAAKVQGEFEVSMELPPSNPDLNRSPSMLESDQSTAGSADVRRRKNWPLLLIFGFLGLLAGLLVGGIYFTKCTKVYQSQATISIRGGLYRLTETLVFGLEDSGTKDHPVTYKAYADGWFFGTRLPMVFRSLNHPLNSRKNRFFSAGQFND